MLKKVYIHDRFYYCLAALVGFFMLSYFVPSLFSVGLMLLVFFGVAVLFDALLLFRFKQPLKVERYLPKKFSNADENSVPIEIYNGYPFKVYCTIIDELPFQFQKRDFTMEAKLLAKQEVEFDYVLRPVERGVYSFGFVHVYASSAIRFLTRRFSVEQNASVAVYPSYLQMRKYEFLAFNAKFNTIGLKKIRRLGHTMEFEQIKNYIPGDDIRTVNWKATAKTGSLMVNQYQDEKSQPIYSIIDTGRAMKMPFEGLKLLDYAINSALAFSNIALIKGDKAGLVSFSKSVDTIIAATNKRTHLNVINEALYNIDTRYSDSDFGLLYGTIKRKIKQRSLLLVYTNFEHMSSLDRQLPFLKALSKNHLVVCIFFKNTTLTTLTETAADDLQTVYHKAIAEKFVYEKQRMAKELERNGIHSILTAPQDLSVNVINSYLTFKARGLL